jgi:hypothetical protein
MVRKRRKFENPEAYLQEQRERGAEILGKHYAGIKDNKDFSFPPVWLLIPLVILLVIVTACMGAAFFLIRLAR